MLQPDSDWEWATVPGSQCPRAGSSAPGPGRARRQWPVVTVSVSYCDSLAGLAVTAGRARRSNPHRRGRPGTAVKTRSRAAAAVQATVTDCRGGRGRGFQRPQADQARAAALARNTRFR